MSKPTESDLARENAIQTYLVDNVPEVLAYGERGGGALSESMTRWLTGEASADEIARLTAFAVSRGYRETQ